MPPARTARGAALPQREAHDLLLPHRLARQLGIDPPIIERDHATAEVDDLQHVRRIEQHRAARIGELAHQEIDLVLGADIDAACRIEQQQHPAFRQQPFSDRDLLLIAAAEAGARPIERARMHLHAG